jgi:DNA-binding FadR family transcriptional regulator
LDSQIDLQPITKVSRTDGVVEQLKSLILEGHLQPGDRLRSERELSEAFNVSRSAVREAKRALTTMGLLEPKPGRGTFVRAGSLEAFTECYRCGWSVSETDTLDLIEARAPVEMTIAALAAKRGTQADAELLDQCLEKMEKAIQERDRDAFLDAGVAVHACLGEATQNWVLAQMESGIRALLRPLLLAAWDAADGAEASLAHYKTIVDAVADRSSRRARVAMEWHFEQLRAAVERDGVTDQEAIGAEPRE